MATILAVDDSSTMRQTLSFTLENNGHDVTLAEDGTVALNIAGTQNFDLVNTDVQMPNMDGITLVAELRKLPGFKVTPVLVLTTESAAQKKQSGRSDWLDSQAFQSGTVTKGYQLYPELRLGSVLDSRVDPEFSPRYLAVDAIPNLP